MIYIIIICVLILLTILFLVVRATIDLAKIHARLDAERIDKWVNTKTR